VGRACSSGRGGEWEREKRAHARAFLLRAAYPPPLAWRCPLGSKPAESSCCLHKAWLACGDPVAGVCRLCVGGRLVVRCHGIKASHPAAGEGWLRSFPAASEDPSTQVTTSRPRRLPDKTVLGLAESAHTLMCLETGELGRGYNLDVVNLKHKVCEGDRWDEQHRSELQTACQC
jgi:hypothetical protein